MIVDLCLVCRSRVMCWCQVNELPLYPNEALLWDENLVPLGQYYGGKVMALPKLNLQFLTSHDYLLRQVTITEGGLPSLPWFFRLIPIHEHGCCHGCSPVVVDLRRKTKTTPPLSSPKGYANFGPDHGGTLTPASSPNHRPYLCRPTVRQELPPFPLESPNPNPSNLTQSTTHSPNMRFSAFPRRHPYPNPSNLGLADE